MNMFNIYQVCSIVSSDSQKNARHFHLSTVPICFMCFDYFLCIKTMVRCIQLFRNPQWDSRKRDWAAIAGHLEMEWLNESPAACLTLLMQIPREHEQNSW